MNIPLSESESRRKNIHYPQNKPDNRLLRSFRDIVSWVRHASYFYGNAIAHPFQVASFGPTFPYVARMISDIADHPQTALELGPGTGAVTEELVRNSGRVVAIEANQRYANVLSQRFQNTNFGLHLDSAANIAEVIEKERTAHGGNGGFNLEAVITSIPFSVLTEEVRKKIIEVALQELDAGGKIISFQHTHVADRTIKEVSADHKALVDINTFRIWGHLPPLVVTEATILHNDRSKP